jgi:MYXO-CTERM domain-containing protein
MKSAERLSTRTRRHSLLLWLFAGLSLFAAKNVFATDYYVSPTGSDTNAGTIDAPFATIQKGADTAVAGDTVWLRGGTYKITTPQSSGAGIEFSKSGTSDTNRINYFAYTGETPLIDFTNMTISTTGYTMGVVVTGSWLHFKGIEECCVPMNTSSNNGFAVDDPATNDIFELLNMHGNSGNGIFIGTKQGGGHQIINCDSHDNYDATSSQGQGQNADGFGVHYQTTGASTIISGCRSWWNSDDGYDLINQEVPVTVENSWAFGMGYANYGTYSPTSGNGNGFKMGSSKTGIRHLVQNNVAWKNKANGFYANHSAGGNTWYNNTAFQNGTNFNMLASSWSEPNGGGTRTDGVILTGDKVHIMRNNLAYPNTISYITGYGVDTAFNTWDLNITAKPSDFLSITDPTVSGTGQAVETSSPALGSRQADGSLPDVDFLKLAAGSQMIDKGTDVGLPYVGAAPDLGAYEYGATAAGGTAGSGGAGGTGGVAGAGGSTAPGGSTASGGGGAAGGSTVVGGASASGGRGGAGGGTAVAGASASGGRGGAGGGTAMGGATVTGGTPAIGGATAIGGAPPAGGTTVTTTATSATGGAVSSGGVVGAGGSSVETGGSTAAGGAIDNGTSSSGGGGSVDTGSVGPGGSVARGGNSGAGGAATSTPGTAATSSGGCSCRMAESRTTNLSGLALLGLAMAVLRPRKRR